jgi:hypothetical protein
MFSSGPFFIMAAPDLTIEAIPFLGTLSLFPENEESSSIVS